MSEIKKVKSPISNSYLTEGKVYEVFGAKHDRPNPIFSIINDKKESTLCLLNNCAHLGGKDWIVVE